MEPLLLGVSSLLSVNLEPPSPLKMDHTVPRCWARLQYHLSRILGTCGHNGGLSRAATMEGNLGWSPAFVTFPPFCHMGVELRLSWEHREASVTQVM